MPQAILKQSKPNPQHQQDADCWDRLIAIENKATLQRRTLIPESRYQPLHSFNRDRQSDMAKINCAIQGRSLIVEQH